ncbi:hypothetical protein LJC56_01730 [Christensenellaceae bacterium OttesenSCG-928-K19]|nr:hypothetical protein [Christensenellaceae bacterium OttesenSCG-928-K19]
MKLWKKIATVAATGALCATLFAGCTETKADDAGKETALYDGMQAGAKLETYRDEDGNEAYSFTNPDGTGGGGVAID